MPATSWKLAGAGEMITGKKPSDKFLEYAQIAGFVLLMGLLLLANGNDIYKWATGTL